MKLQGEDKKLSYVWKTMSPGKEEGENRCWGATGASCPPILQGSAEILPLVQAPPDALQPEELKPSLLCLLGSMALRAFSLSWLLLSLCPHVLSPYQKEGSKRAGRMSDSVCMFHSRNQILG